MNRFKKATNKKKWEQDIAANQNTDVFKYYKPFNEEEPKQESVKQEKDKQQTEDKIEQSKPKKYKQYEWMSDSDIQQPSKDKKQSKQNKVAQQIKEEGYIDLFVTKIPAKIAQDDLVKYLNNYGTVKDMFMPLIQGTQIHKGKAFVQFIPANPTFLQLKQHKIKGYVIDISNKILFNQNKQRSRSNSGSSKNSRSRSRSRSKQK